MNFTDRLIRGFTAGLISGIAVDVLDLLSNTLGIDEMTYFDWAGIVIFGSTPNKLSEYMVSVFAQLFLCGILGIIYAYLIPQVTSKNHLLKGWIFGVTTWFVFFLAAFVFKLGPLLKLQEDSAGSDAITGSVFGIVLALTLKWLDRRKYRV